MLKTLLLEWPQFLKGHILTAAARVGSTDKAWPERRQPPCILSPVGSHGRRLSLSGSLWLKYERQKSWLGGKEFTGLDWFT